MTIKGLRDGLVQDLAESVYGTYWFGLEGTKMLCEALDKQIPKKPVRRFDDDDEEWYDCPTCGRALSVGLKIIIDHRYEYCSCCGQHIDWRGDESDE